MITELQHTFQQGGGVVLRNAPRPIGNKPICQCRHRHHVNAVHEPSLVRDCFRSPSSPDSKNRRDGLRLAHLLALEDETGLARGFSRLFEISTRGRAADPSGVRLRLDGEDATRCDYEMIHIEAANLNVRDSTPHMATLSCLLDLVIHE